MHFQYSVNAILTSFWKFSLSMKKAVMGFPLTAQYGTCPRFSTSSGSSNMFIIRIGRFGATSFIDALICSAKYMQKGHDGS